MSQHYLRESHAKASSEKKSQRTPSQCKLLIKLVPRKCSKDTFREIEPQSKLLPGKISLGRDSLGTAEGMCSVRQKHISSGNAVCNCDSHESDKDLVIQEEEESVFKCHHCGKIFSKKRLLAQHERSHSGVKPYECTKCGKAFSKSAYLLQHQMVHSGEKPYKCMECKKAFGRKSHLTQHRRIHSGEKPYKCDECGRAFTHSSTFALHNRSHTGENLLSVKNVEKLFETGQALI